MEQTAADLAKESKGQHRKGHSGIRVPIMVALLMQLVVAVAIVVIPLGYISLSSSKSITADLTSRIVNATIVETSDRLNSFFSTFAMSMKLAGQSSGVPYLLDCCYESLDTPSVNLTLSLIRLMNENPLCTGLTISYPVNLTESRLPRNGPPTIGVAAYPCSFFKVPLNATCYARIWQDVKTNSAIYGRILATNTGVDLTPSIKFAPALTEPGRAQYPEDARWGNGGPSRPFWTVVYTPGVFAGFFFKFYIPVITRLSDPARYMVLTAGYLDCIGILQSLFTQILPTPDSTLYLVDEFGYMVSSTLNGSALVNTTRYLATESPSSLVSTVSKYLESNIAPLNQSFLFPNQTTQFVTVDGVSNIVLTKTLFMPVSNQPYQIVLIVPRVAFYGSSDDAYRTSIITACSVAAGGVVLMALLAYFASLPLKQLAKSMSKLTKFDFTVLESGQLDHQSIITELGEVEVSFLTMVKAFAVAIKKNKDLITGSHGTRSATASAIGKNTSAMSASHT